MPASDRPVPLPEPPRDPAAGPPPRRPGSVRRTSTILMTWPEGFGTPLRLDGRSRDLLTPVEGRPSVLAQDEFCARVGPDRTVQEIETRPARAGIERLVGARGGSQLRSALRAVAPQEIDAGTPLSLLLDDVAGSTLIAGFAWSRWSDTWMRPQPSAADAAAQQAMRRKMVGICAGFRPGSQALANDGATSNPQIRHNVAEVPPLADPADPWSWHELDPHPPVAMRRARRIDLWVENGAIGVDAMFRDSCWQPDGAEVGVHEYSIDATIDTATGELTRVMATPRVLPFAECPAAAPNAAWMAGIAARQLRTAVLERLRGTDCCTHLNDALRSMAEVPVLATALQE
jgi:hypothetical protein